MTMKMKRQNYFGKPAIAIYIQDVTKKLKRRLSHLQLQEDKQKAQTAESYKSTISHELRTPIKSASTLLAQVLLTLNTTAPTKEMLKQAAKYASLILQTLGLMESFVEDLLNLRLMSEGILTLAKDVFDPREAFNFIKDTFAIKVESKGI